MVLFRPGVCHPEPQLGNAWSIAVLLVGAALGLFDRKLPGDAHGTSLNPDP